MSRNRLVYFSELQKRYGEFVRIKYGGPNLYLLSNPELIRELTIEHADQIIKTRALADLAKPILGRGILAHSGPRQKRHRRIIQKEAFQAKHLPRHASLVHRTVDSVIESWKPKQTIDLEVEMKRIAFGVASEVVFGQGDLEEQASIGKNLGGFAELFPTMFRFRYILLQYLPFTPRTSLDVEVAKANKLIYRMIEHRKTTPGDDLMSALTRWRDPESGESMTDQQIRDECVNVLLPGYTSNIAMLVWTHYFISQHQEVEAKLMREVRRVMKSDATLLEKFSQLRFTKSVIAEAMRLFPPVPLYGYRTANRFQLDGYSIPSGSTFIICPYVTQRNRRYWDKPTQFLPERWEDFSIHDAGYQFYPFGGGPRICVGASLAWVETTLAVAMTLNRWNLQLAQTSPIRLNVTFGLRSDGIKMKVSPRS